MLGLGAKATFPGIWPRVQGSTPFWCDLQRVKVNRNDHVVAVTYRK